MSESEGPRPPLLGRHRVPGQVAYRRVIGAHRAPGHAGPTRGYLFTVALLAGTASMPIIAAISTGSATVGGTALPSTNTPFIPPPSRGPVVIAPPDTATPTGTRAAPSRTVGPSATAGRPAPVPDGPPPGPRADPVPPRPPRTTKPAPSRTARPTPTVTPSPSRTPTPVPTGTSSEQPDRPAGPVPTAAPWPTPWPPWSTYDSAVAAPGAGGTVTLGDH